MKNKFKIGDVVQAPRNLDEPGRGHVIGKITEVAKLSKGKFRYTLRGSDDLMEDFFPESVLTKSNNKNLTNFLR